MLCLFNNKISNFLPKKLSTNNFISAKINLFTNRQSISLRLLNTENLLEYWIIDTTIISQKVVDSRGVKSFYLVPPQSPFIKN